MNLRCIIVDDEPPAVDELVYILSEIDEVEVVATAGSASKAVQAIKSLEPDVVFLDIHMPGHDGFYVVEEISSSPRPPFIIFVTAYDQYALRAFEANAADYVLKPFSEARIRESVSRARRREDTKAARLTGQELRTIADFMARGQEVITKVPVDKGGRILLLDTAEIVFCRTDEKRITAHTKNASFPVHALPSLDALEERLRTRPFFRSHRSYLVNLSHVREIVPLINGRYLLTMHDENTTEIPLSRTRVREFKEKLGLASH
ncbi:MAG: response regulator transcription factor [Deltaproteobacteria bacterium]|nr:response regulator transcription factor [Deltaproteobacteria bacterium]